MTDNMASTLHNKARDSCTISRETRTQDQSTELSNPPSTPSAQGQDNEPSDPILAALDRTRRKLQEIAASDQPIAAERRRQLNHLAKIVGICTRTLRSRKAAAQNGHTLAQT